MSLTDSDRQLHICVDFLLPRISPNISAKLRDLDADMLENYLCYLDRMTHCPADWLIIPGHDWPYYGGGARARQLCDHHAARLDQLLQSGQQSQSLLTFSGQMNGAGEDVISALAAIDVVIGVHASLAAPGLAG